MRARLVAAASPCRAPARAGAWLVLGLALLSCSHDLDALTSANGDVRGGDGGRGGKSGSGGKAGKGGSGGADKPDGGGGSGGTGARDAGPECGPCEDLSTQAMTLGLRDCCRGTTGDECGLTFADGTLCLPRMVPGVADATCPAVRLGMIMQDGCCRPDGRCGVSGDNLGLGCVAREELGAVAGGTPPPALSCEYACSADQDCNAVLPGLVCAESPDHSKRFCAKACKRDQDCTRGEICGLSNDQGMDRVLAICRAPIGDVAPGEFCSAAKDCIHGICLMAEQICSKPCANSGECGTGFSRCANAMISSPSGGSRQNFSICVH